MLFAVLVVSMTFFGTTAILFGLFSEENAAVSGIPRSIDGGFWDSVWWALNYVMRLPAFEEMYGASVPILAYSMLLSIMGLGVFGVLVSVINNAMRSRIELLRQGDTPVKERGHLLILGWNNKVFSVLRQLARLQPGARVVILAAQEMADMSEDLRLAGIPNERITVILRSGVPTNRAELERMAVDRASGVIVLSGRSDDSGAIKTLVLLANWEQWQSTRPTLVAEVALERNFELAEIGARKRIHIVSSSRVTSKVIVQTLRNPGLARVYDELMSTEGNSIYVQSIPECTGKTLREIAQGFDAAIPIGISWRDGEKTTRQYKAGLNPEPDYDLAEDERLVMITRGVPVSYSPPSGEFTSSVFKDRTIATSAPQRILLIGWTDSLYDILHELNAHATLGTEVTVLSNLDTENAREQLAADTTASLQNLTLEFRQGDAPDRSAWDDLEITSYDSLVVLADEMSDGDADTHSLRTVLRIAEFAEQAEIKANMIVELLDGANRDLFTALGVRDVVISSEVISAQLAQISRQTVLGSIYRELLSAGGVEISLRPINEYIDTNSTTRFEDLIYAAQQNSEVALGLFRDDGELLLNPPRASTWQLGALDRLVVLAEQIYR